MWQTSMWQSVALRLTLCGDAPMEHALPRDCDTLPSLSADCMLTQYIVALAHWYLLIGVPKSACDICRSLACVRTAVYPCLLDVDH